jgi:hypothetical protein
MVVGVSQIGSRKMSAKTKVVECARLGTQAGNDVAQTFTVSELAEAQRQKVIIFRKSTRRARIGKAFDAARKLCGI